MRILSDGQIMLLIIESVETKVITGKDQNGNPIKTTKMTVKTSDGKKYSYFVNSEDGDWGQGLKAGRQIWVYAWDKQSIYKGRAVTYHNIGKPSGDVPFVPPINSKGISIPIPINPPTLPNTTPEPPAWLDDNKPPESAQETHIPYKTDKDKEIRLQLSMKCASWIVAGMDLKKLGEPEIKNLLIIYIDFFNEFQPGMTYDTLPISKSQIITLHNRLIYHGISKLFYHQILEKIIGKKVIKTTDLTYIQASECLKRFDEVLNELNQAETPEPPKQAPLEDDPYPTLPF